MKKENFIKKSIMSTIFLVLVFAIFTGNVNAEQPEWPLDFSTDIRVLGERINIEVENGKLSQAGFSLNKPLEKRFEVVPFVGDFSTLPTNIPELRDQNKDLWYNIGENNYEEYQNLKAGEKMDNLKNISKLMFITGGPAGYTPELTKYDYNLNYANYRRGVLTLSVDKYRRQRLAAYEYDGYPHGLLEASITEEIKYRFINKGEKSGSLEDDQARWNVQRKVDRKVDIFDLQQYMREYKGFRGIGSFSETEKNDNLRLLVSDLGQTVKGEADLIDPVGEVTYVYGIVEVKKEGLDEWIEARQGDQLMPGDLVRTGRNSKLEIDHKRAQKIIGVSSNSELMFTEELNEEDKLWDVLRFFFGFMYINGKEIDGELNVHTPRAVCGVRGTVYSVEVKDDLETFSVYQGSIVLTAADKVEDIDSLDNDKLDEIGIFLSAGQRITIDENDNFSEIENLTEAEINRGINNSIME